MEEQRFATRMQGIKGNAIREILKVTQQPGMISFAGGMPSPASFEIETVKQIVNDVMDRDGKTILQYGATQGYAPLRKELIEFVKNVGLSIEQDNLLVLSGSQQGINLAAKAMLDPGDKVIVESPSYLAALQIFKTYQAEFIVVPSDEDGIDMDILEEKIRTENPKIVYIIPNFQNPSSRTLPMAKRLRIADMLKKYKTLLIEDDPYGYLRYSGEHLPSITSMDTTNQSIYLGSFSKLVSPGLRVGYVVGPKDVISKMRIGKQGTDVHTSLLSQAIVGEYLSRGLLMPHVEDIKKMYKEKRDLFLAEMAEHFPTEAHWNKPDGGLFIWVEMPEGYDIDALFQKAIAQKVAFVPGASFFVEQKTNCLRLNFSNASAEEIKIGVKKLGQAMKECL